MDVRFVNDTSGMKMMVDRGAPYYIARKKWMKKHMEEGAVNKDKIKCQDCYKRYRFSEDVYESKTRVTFPLNVKGIQGDYIKRKVVAYLIYREEDIFLFVRKELRDQNASLHMDENVMELRREEGQLRYIGRQP